jgi:hypothetical protein
MKQPLFFCVFYEFALKSTLLTGERWKDDYMLLRILSYRGHYLRKISYEGIGGQGSMVGFCEYGVDLRGFMKAKSFMTSR